MFLNLVSTSNDQLNSPPSLTILLWKVLLPFLVSYHPSRYRLDQYQCLHYQLSLLIYLMHPSGQLLSGRSPRLILAFLYSFLSSFVLTFAFDFLRLLSIIPAWHCQFIYEGHVIWVFSYLCLIVYLLFFIPIDQLYQWLMSYHFHLVHLLRSCSLIKVIAYIRYPGFILLFVIWWPLCC